MAEEPIQFLESEPPAASPEKLGESGEREPVTESPSEQALEKSGEKYSQILSQVKTASSSIDPASVVSDASGLSGDVDTQAIVTKLVALAETKGVAHAVAVAKKMQDLYILDTMHDTLADEFYDALKAKGLISGE